MVPDGPTHGQDAHHTVPVPVEHLATGLHHTGLRGGGEEGEGERRGGA